MECVALKRLERSSVDPGGGSSCAKTDSGSTGNSVERGLGAINNMVKAREHSSDIFLHF
jgi:hypothetical protein